MTGRQRAMRLAGRHRLTVVDRSWVEQSSDPSILFLRADAVLDESLVQALLDRPASCLALAPKAGLAPLAIVGPPTKAAEFIGLLDATGLAAEHEPDRTIN